MYFVEYSYSCTLLWNFFFFFSSSFFKKVPGTFKKYFKVVNVPVVGTLYCGVLLVASVPPVVAGSRFELLVLVQAPVVQYLFYFKVQT